jgi:putative tryptophan/tyrosine transport system substrate-binding protein
VNVVPISVSRISRARFRQVFCGVLWLLLPLHFSAYAADLRVLLVLSGSEAPYQTFAQAFMQNSPANIQVAMQQYSEALPGGDQQIDLIVTVGEKAAEQLVPHTGRPVLAAMLPSFRYAELASRRHPGGALSAIFVDQPWERQVSLLRAALPYRNKIGVLLSPGTDWKTGQLRKLLQERGATLVTRVADPSGTLSDDLEHILSRSDVLLAVPDNTIYNSISIRDIILSSYRRRIPLVGLSRAYVDAGALCAVFSTLEQLAGQTSAAASAYARSRQLPKPQYPDSYTIAVNQQVARSLGIELPSPDTIRKQIDQAKGDGP